MGSMAGGDVDGWGGCIVVGVVDCGLSGVEFRECHAAIHIFCSGYLRWIFFFHYYVAGAALY